MGFSHLIIGGAKSGKSKFAQQMGEQYPAPRLYIATAEPVDQEMVEKIELHKMLREDKWDTIEEALKLPEAILISRQKYSIILVDCITFWVNNLLLKANVNMKGMEKILDNLANAVKTSACPILFVSNEVGMGIVPEYPLVRTFRELAGYANQRIADFSEKVSLCVAGIQFQLK